MIPQSDIDAVLALPNAAERAAAMAALLEGKGQQIATTAWSDLADQLQQQALGDEDDNEY